jgi:hypothetical protein
MSRAASGVFARARLRRNFAEYYNESVVMNARCWSKCPLRQGMERKLHPNQDGSTKFGSFTLHLSDFGVGSGRLGEVVSLVGDCRPPPPGNPRRPKWLGNPGLQVGIKQTESSQVDRGDLNFSSINPNFGGVFSPLSVSCTFNIDNQDRNLKILQPGEYFKISRSSIYCRCWKPVLEFEHLHSHLCGSTGVKPLSIAITNVLGIQE